MKHSLLFIYIFLSCSTLFAQGGGIQTEPKRMSLAQFQTGGYMPFGDMGKKYGVNASVGFAYAYKTKSNLLFGADFNYLFGNNVKNQDQLFKELRISTGQIIGINEEFVNALILERGYATGFYGGKIFNIIGPNTNSGLVIKIGINYFEHRTHIETREDKYSPLQGEYVKGYDRKIAGLAINEFIGYQHFSNSRLANFFIGFDIYQGFTTDYRSYNIDLMQKTNNDYFDLLIGIKAGWVIPIYKRVSNTFYID